jgi:hypothetical protein
MSETKHAPGPWRVNSIGNVVATVKSLGETIEVTVCVPNNRPDTAANARLIAAAPEYAAGVEQMLAHEQAGGEGWWAGWEMLKAAHAKAEGQS